MGERLDYSFYRRKDILAQSKELLGMKLVTNFNGHQTSGLIVETEAYVGPQDKASHAYARRRTKRTETMYADGGIAYIYLCYGVHHLFNIVVGEADHPLAILVRGVEPVEGIEMMLQRCHVEKMKPSLVNGPGKLTKALGITTQFNRENLVSGHKIWIEKSDVIIKPEDILASPRIGVGYAEEDALLPYRFTIKGNPFVSR